MNVKFKAVNSEKTTFHLFINRERTGKKALELVCLPEIS